MGNETNGTILWFLGSGCNESSVILYLPGWIHKETVVKISIPQLWRHHLRCWGTETFDIMKYKTPLRYILFLLQRNIKQSGIGIVCLLIEGRVGWEIIIVT